MADDKKVDQFAPVRVVAVELGFRNGVMVPRGTVFMFTPRKGADGKPLLDKDGNVKLPKWAQRAEKPLPVPKPTRADLKPLDTQAAVAAKAGALAAGVMGGMPPSAPLA
jgi:hypothetical protein